MFNARESFDGKVSFNLQRQINCNYITGKNMAKTIANSRLCLHHWKLISKIK